MIIIYLSPVPSLDLYAFQLSPKDNLRAVQQFTRWVKDVKIPAYKDMVHQKSTNCPIADSCKFVHALFCSITQSVCVYPCRWCGPGSPRNRPSINLRWKLLACALTTTQPHNSHFFHRLTMLLKSYNWVLPNLIIVILLPTLPTLAHWHKAVTSYKWM